MATIHLSFFFCCVSTYNNNQYCKHPTLATVVLLKCIRNSRKTSTVIYRNDEGNILKYSSASGRACIYYFTKNNMRSYEILHLSNEDYF